MLADRKRTMERARRSVPIDFDLGTDPDDRDGFDDLLALAGEDADLLRLRFGVGVTLSELADATGTTLAIVSRRIDRMLAMIRPACR